MVRLKTTYLKYRYLIYFFSLVAGWPSVFYLIGWLPHYKVNYYILLILVGLTALIKSAYRYVPKQISIIILFQIMVWLLYGVFYFDSSYLTRVFILLITFSILGLQLSYRSKFEFIKTYNFWLTSQVVAGSIGFILAIFGLLNPISQFVQMDGRPGYFFGLFTTNTFFMGFVRNAGFYDEPGSLACWGIFALLLNKLFIGNKKIEYLLLFGLISTLSLAYFTQLAVYIFLFYKNQRKNIFRLSLFLTVIIIGLASYNDIIENAIYGRFIFDEASGAFSGDNRSELFVKCWRIFITSPITGVGANNLATTIAAKEGFVGANFFVNFASDGILGAVSSYMPFLLLLKLGLRKPQYKYAFLIIFIGYLQRPYTESILLYPLLQYTILLFAYLDTKNITLQNSFE